MKTFKKIVKIFFVYMILFFVFYTIHFCDENGVIEELIVNGSKVPTSNVVFLYCNCINYTFNCDNSVKHATHYCTYNCKHSIKEKQ